MLLVGPGRGPRAHDRGRDAEPELAEVLDALVEEHGPRHPLVIARGDGCMVTDVEGNRYIDFAAGIAVCSTGHSHPKVVQAIKDQADRLIHIAATDFYEPRYLEFMERLAAIAPFEEKARVFLTNSGTEAVEGAIKLARKLKGPVLEYGIGNGVSILIFAGIVAGLPKRARRPSRRR